MSTDDTERKQTPLASSERIGRLLILTFIGGTLGSIARELLIPMLSGFPDWIGVMLVNGFACFLLGWLYGARDRLHHHLLQFAAVGFCGSVCPPFAALSAVASLEASAWPVSSALADFASSLCALRSSLARTGSRPSRTGASASALASRRSRGAAGASRTGSSCGSTKLSRSFGSRSTARRRGAASAGAEAIVSG